MIADLSDFARGIGRDMPVRRQQLDFGDVCVRIVEETRQAYPDAAIELTASGNLRGAWDGDRLGQAVSNLLSNAIQHGEPPVAIRVSGDGDDVILNVSNHGTPIPSHAIPDLFEPFSFTTSSDGLGLGLFIVSQIVAAHGGSIDVRSSAADGTTFTSRWPRG